MFLCIGNKGGTALEETMFGTSWKYLGTLKNKNLISDEKKTSFPFNS